MVCFPVGCDEEPLETVKNFIDESSKFCKHIFIVGTKTDLRAGKDKAKQFKQMKELTKELNGQAYLECSAQKNDGSVEETFQEVVKRVSAGIRYYETKCTVSHRELLCHSLYSTAVSSTSFGHSKKC